MGYTVDEISAFDGETVLGMVHPDDMPLLRDAWAGLADHKVAEVSYRQRTKAGEYRWLSNRMTIVCDEAGVPLYRDGNIRDITEERRVAEELRKSSQAKTNFISVLAHELRNPMAPLLSSLEMLQILLAEVDAPQDGVAAELQSAMDVAFRQIRIMTRLLDDLLDVSRLAHGKIELKKERVDLGSAISHAVVSVRPLLDAKQHALSVEVPDEDVVFDADPVRLEQLIVNLLTNAAKYTPPHGNIRLRAACEKGQVVIRIADDGIGIQKETLEKVFNEFFQSDHGKVHAQGGLGIGLTLVESLCRLHGGRVSASSGGPNKGSEFAIYLPLTQKESAVSAAIRQEVDSV